MLMTKKIKIFGQEKCTPRENRGYAYGYNLYHRDTSACT